MPPNFNTHKCAVNLYSITGSAAGAYTDSVGSASRCNYGDPVPLTLDFQQLRQHVPYSTYYKPMGDLPYISSEQGVGL